MIELVIKDKELLKLDDLNIGTFRGLLTQFIMKKNKNLGYNEIYILFENINLNNILRNGFRIVNLVELLHVQLSSIDTKSTVVAITQYSLNDFIKNILEFKEN